MMRLAAAVLVAAALLVPAAATAQSPEPAASAAPMESPTMVGVDTMDVCLSISGPVTLLTADSLTQGIIDGTFVINGLSESCEPMAAAPEASPDAIAPASPVAPMGSPEASPAS